MGLIDAGGKIRVNEENVFRTCCVFNNCGVCTVNEATKRKKKLAELVFWKILEEKDFEGEEGENLLSVVGDLEPGLVLVKNKFGASWTMTPGEFDQEYVAR